MAPITALRWLIRPRWRMYAAPSVAVYAVVVTVVITVTDVAGAYWNTPGGEIRLGRLLATGLVVALVNPVTTTCAVAARLSQRHRRELLSTVRLLGGSSSFVRQLSLFGEATTAVIGAALGSAAAVLVTLIRGVWTPDVTVPVGSILLAVLGVMVVAALSSVGDLRAILTRPLSVRMRSNAATVRAGRVLAGVALFAGAMILLRLIGPGWGLIAVVSAVTVAVLAVNAVLGLLGPWVVSALASRRVARITSATQLIALRDILESPTAAWRQVSTLALMSFLLVPVGSLLAYLSLIQKSTPDMDPRFISDFADVRTTVLVIIAATLALTITAIGAGQGAAIEERRELHVALHRIGMSSKLIAQARRHAVALPLNVAVIGSASLSVIFFWWLVIAGMASMSFHLPATAAALLGSILAVLALLRSTGFLIRRQLRPKVIPDEEIGAPAPGPYLR